MNKLKIGIVEEGKTPPDERVPLLPEHCKTLMEQFPCQVFVQRSKVRRVKDDEYAAAGIELVDDVSHCDVLFGVKEVPVTRLIPDKTYLFFSHTIKKQSHNRKLLQELLRLNIRMIDYECLTDEKGFRIIGFGRFAGIVGTYNGFRMIGEKTGKFALKPAHRCFDRDELLRELKNVTIAAMKICMTGTGRVAGGALEVLRELGIRKVSVDEFLNDTFSEPVFVQLDVLDYNRRIDGKLGSLDDFIKDPEAYEGTFRRFLSVTDYYIACHFWSNRAPIFYDRNDMKQSSFNISYIADISCDIDGPLASTIRASTITSPFYGIDKSTGEEIDFMQEDALAVMAVDNLPCELPLDASKDFGDNIVAKVMPEFFNGDVSGVLKRASITENGKLTEKFQYLSEFARG